MITIQSNQQDLSWGFQARDRKQAKFGWSPVGDTNKSKDRTHQAKDGICSKRESGSQRGRIFQPVGRWGMYMDELTGTSSPICLASPSPIKEVKA